MTIGSTLAPTVLLTRPAFEGANIRTWIGFKHFMYLVEEAARHWLRERGFGARTLFHEYGLGVDVLECSVQLPAVLEIDDEVRAEVVAGADRRLKVVLTVPRDGRDVVVLRGTVTLALVREPGPGGLRSAPADLARFEAAGRSDGSGPPAQRLEPPMTVRAALAPPGSPAFLLSWRAPYYYCHYSDRVQHSGFVRGLETLVDEFLNHRGISVGRLLAERSWIPVVSRARVRLLGPAHMDETIHSVLTVGDIMRDVMFEARMDCYVQRGAELVPVATGSILHGYAISRGDRAGELASLDGAVLAALTGSRS